MTSHLKDRAIIKNIDQYFSWGLHLFPLDGTSKKPKYTGWQNRNHSREELIAHAQNSGNLGWRIPKGYVVLDFDGRHNGEDGMKRMLADLGISDFSVRAPVVRTGDGYHGYFRIPLDKLKLKKSAEIKALYPGLDIKQYGGYVVAAGSYHTGKGRFYEFDEFSLFNEPPMLPSRIQEKLSKGDEPVRVATGQSHFQFHHAEAVTPSPGLTNDELAQLLDQLAVENYRQYDDWLRIAMASHHATKGEGLIAFLSWSLSDPVYASDADVITAKWRGFRHAW